MSGLAVNINSYRCGEMERDGWAGSVTWLVRLAGLDTACIAGRSGESFAIGRAARVHASTQYEFHVAVGGGRSRTVIILRLSEFVFLIFSVQTLQSMQLRLSWQVYVEDLS